MTDFQFNLGDMVRHPAGVGLVIARGEWLFANPVRNHYLLAPSLEADQIAEGQRSIPLRAWYPEDTLALEYAGVVTLESSASGALPPAA